MNKIITPMLVQYLVGLCCLRVNPDAVDITLGDMVLDPAAEKKRDVDVTVTVQEQNGGVRALKAYEVKNESTALDVMVVEQLCIKLNDMPSITHRAIISASGFTDAATKKAAHHKVELYSINPWTKPIQEQFPEVGLAQVPQECLRFERNLLCWPQSKLHLVAPSAGQPFSVQHSDSLFSKSGKPHKKFKTFGAFREELLLRSTEFLWNQEPATSVASIFPQEPAISAPGIYGSPLWPHTHTLDVGSDEVYVMAGGALAKLTGVTINGHLQWQRTVEVPNYYVIERVSDGLPLSAALVSLGVRDGTMFCLTFSPSTRDVGVQFVRLSEKHWNAIRNLKLTETGDY